MSRLFITEKNFYRNMLVLSLPIVLQNLISNGLAIADNIMVGSLGEVAISSVTQANQITFVLNLFLFGLGSGSSVLIAQYWGKRDTVNIGHVMGISLLISGAFSLVFAFGALVFPESLMSIYTNEPALIEQGARYLRLVGISYLPAALSSCLMINMRSIEKPAVAMCVTFGSFCINVFLNWCLIFGKLGFPALGVRGAAIATTVARFFEMGAIFLYVFRIDKVLKVRLQNLFPVPKDLFRDFRHYCTPVIFNESLWGIGFSVASMIFGRLGISSVTAYSLARVLENLMLVFGASTGAACGVLVGKALGVGDTERAKATARTMLVMNSGIGLFFGLITLSIRPLFLSFYNLEPATYEIANKLIFTMACYMFVKAFTYCMIIGTLRAGGDTRFAMVIDIVFLWCVSIPLVAFAAFVLHWPVYFVYPLLMVDEVLKSIIALRRFHSDKWMRNVTR